MASSSILNICFTGANPRRRVFPTDTTTLRQLSEARSSWTPDIPKLYRLFLMVINARCLKKKDEFRNFESSLTQSKLSTYRYVSITARAEAQARARAREASSISERMIHNRNDLIRGRFYSTRVTASSRSNAPSRSRWLFLGWKDCESFDVHGK